MVDKGFHFPLTLTAAEQFASALAGALVQLWWHVWMLMHNCTSSVLLHPSRGQNRRQCM